MVREDLDRPLAFVLSQFPAPARARLIQILPPPLRGKVTDLQGTVADLPRSEMTFVEQVLQADLEAVFTQEADSEARLFSEALPLRVSDVIALLLKHTTPQQAAEAVLRLPPALQGEVLHKVAAQDRGVLERRLGRAEVAFLEAMESAWDAPAGGGGDPRFVAEVLRRLQATGAVRRLLTEMHRMDPESTDAVRDMLYGFEELVRLTDLELQTVLTGIDQWDLVLALRSAPLGLRRRVLANISERRAKYLAEDEAVLEEMEEAQVRSVQHRIVERVRQLYEAGKVHTYFGSVGEEEEAGAAAEGEAPVESSSSRSDLPEEPVRRRFDLRGAGMALGGIALAVLLLIWFTGVRSTSPPSGVRTARPAVIGDTDVQRDGLKRGGKTRRSRGDGGAVPDVVLVEGQAFLISGESKRPAKGETLQPGDRVETDTGGRTVVRLWAGSGQVQVEENSSVQMGEEGQTREEVAQVNLRLGNIWVHATHPALEVKSPLAQMTASEGALYQMRVVLDATTTLSVHRGTVWVKPLVESENGSLVLGPGDEVRIFPSGRIAFEKQKQESGWLGVF